MAIGAGYYAGGLIATAIVLLALAGRYFKPGMRRRKHETVVIELSTTRRKRIHEALELLARNEVQIENLKASHEGSTHMLHVEARVGDENLLNRFVQTMRMMPDIEECTARSVTREFG
jgi:uncharacterized membrane protein YhiD involved in acid resistance